MNYKKRIQEMIEKITEESVLKVIYDFVEVPYSREILKSDGEKENELQENDYWIIGKSWMWIHIKKSVQIIRIFIFKRGVTKRRRKQPAILKYRA